ncbi:peptide/nickel transport system substrate-binding protein [Tistlia consotensis]|uniref:Peptide/nickel transport system substrate-binding protein n=1 Tax=Tistlia consotensis USBA 355 TaxID=560819 RepID=A0A1Y6CFZ6_9PROT|nr:ABC transporter substrate-binding protein [Tistlia consotensis]SMF59444.1 peptide/nickel transport system substrate-binding protein [Tistlia consotensis USBA 355]SNR64334.1 peptide/nickel transport system substrate-binding protein [Tistlia consotensis]
MTRMLRSGGRLAAALALGTLVGATLAQPAPAFEKTSDGPVLVFGGRQPVPNLDPSQKYDWSTRMLQQSLYDALVKYEGDPAEIEPWLAKSWEKNGDATVWTFHLVDNAKFANGDPVDAAAVKFSFERTLKINKGPAWMLSSVLAPDGIAVVDPHTLRFTLKQPYAPFLAFLPWWYVMDPKEVMAHEKDGDLGQAWMTEHAAGSGPFKQGRWEQGTLYQLIAKNDYWKGWPHKTHPAGIIYKLMREASSQRAALIAGQADIVEGLSSEDFDVVGKMPGIAVEDHGGMTTFGIKFNTQVGPTADLNLRKAIAYAFDYKALLQIYNGAAKLEDSPFPPAIKGHVTLPDMPRQDLAKAKEYLAKSAYAKGGIELEYVYVQGLEEERKIGLVLIDNLKPLGITVKLVPLTWPNMTARAEKVETAPAMIAIFATPVATDPDAVAFQYHKASWGKYYGSHYLKDPELDALIEKARATADWDKRAPLYLEIQKRILADQPEVFGMLANRRWARRDWVEGFKFSPVNFTGETDLYQLTVAPK